MSQLQLISGKMVQSVEFLLSETVTIGTNDIEEVTLFENYIQLLLEEYSLSIYNNVKLAGISRDKLKQLKGQKITQVIEEESRIVLRFGQDINIEIDMTDNGFTGPEAMHLEGPDSLSIVWN